jgi:leucyl aminopeptidase (aminopeptidase T)
MKSPELANVSRTIVENLGEVTENEDVLVLTDPELESIGQAISDASREVGANTLLTVMEQIDVYGNEPPTPVTESMKQVDIVFSVLSTSLTHTDARREAAEQGTRTFILRGVTIDTMLEGSINTDYDELTERTTAVHEKLAAGSKAHITSPEGTDITMSLEGRSGYVLDGSFGGGVPLSNAVPAGEAPIAPVEGTANGEIVVDYSMDNIGRVDEPISLHFTDGYVDDVTGSNSADRLRRIIQSADDEAGNLAEFAIGTNPDARLTGILAEDKKVEGTVHFAIGDNKSLEGDVASSIHLDGMVLDPTVKIDGETIVEEGSIVVNY